MNGYRYWVERHKLLVELASAKDKIEGLPEAERQQRTMALEGEFRAKLDALYGKVGSEFESPPVAKA
jgi:hypothetical protein